MVAGMRERSPDDELRLLKAGTMERFMERFMERLLAWTAPAHGTVGALRRDRALGSRSAKRKPGDLGRRRVIDLR
jgi:hypothetical protein